MGFVDTERLRRLPAEERLIVALDSPERDAALSTCRALMPPVAVFKVGLELFVGAGPRIVRDIMELGAAVFLDLKFHDIPEQVAGACRASVALGPSMFTVHTLGGREMLERAVEATRSAAAELGTEPPKILGVTVLTSLDEADLERMGLEGGLGSIVVGLARRAREASLDGVIAAASDVRAIREVCGPEFMIAVPGIRPDGGGQVGRGWGRRGEDQKRIATPAEGIRSGATYLVVGRPITAAPDMRAGAEAILKEMRAAEMHVGEVSG